jgi:hypothetical protein
MLSGPIDFCGCHPDNVLPLDTIVGGWQNPGMATGLRDIPNNNHHNSQKDQMDGGTDPDIARRRVLVKSNPSVSVTKMCEILDRHRVPLPHTWPGFGFTTWSETHKNLRYRARIKQLISRDVMRE